MRLPFCLLMIFSFLTLGDFCQAKSIKRQPAKVTKVTKATKAIKAKTVSVSAPAVRAPAAMANDPNRTVEIRGQSRTLSMMLVLKNGKDSINFIKIRKDYAAEISGTEF